MNKYLNFLDLFNEYHTLIFWNYPVFVQVLSKVPNHSLNFCQSVHILLNMFLTICWFLKQWYIERLVKSMLNALQSRMTVNTCTRLLYLPIVCLIRNCCEIAEFLTLFFYMNIVSFFFRWELLIYTN